MSKLSLLPAPVAAALTAVATRFGALSHALKITIVSATALGILLGALGVYRESRDTYGVLFSQLEQDDAGSVVAKLKELKVPYLLQAGGATIEVPEARVAEVRMELAAGGLPRGGGVGFESFDKLRLGATEFEQRVLYRRALEGELARTIGSLGAVQSARVHLVMPEKSVFVQRAEAASASILLHLRPGRTVGPGEVKGIVGLTAAAVPGLTPDHIAVVTADGQMLKKPRAAGAADGSSNADEDQSGEQRALEAQLEERARSMLERVVGVGHVDVRVTAELDPARVEHTEDHYDPTRTALRSEEQTHERTALALDDSVAGVPGAESNLPSVTGGEGPSPVASAAAPSASASAAPRRVALAMPLPHAAEQPFRESHTRNFEVDHVSEKRSVSPGALKRVGVAVILDGVPSFEGGKKAIVPRDRAELDRFSALVRSAVGARDERGDSVTVESVPFGDAVPSPDSAPAEAPVGAVLPTARSWKSYAPAALAAVVLLGAAFVLARRRTPPQRSTGDILLTTLEDSPRLSPSETSADLRARALERAAQDPATAALVLRLWLGTTDAEVRG